MDVITTMGYSHYLEVAQGSAQYDVHYAYYRRFSELERIRSALLQEEDRAWFTFRLGEDECRAVAAGQEVRAEPKAIEKSEPPKLRTLTYEEGVAKAWREADQANAQVGASAPSRVIIFLSVPVQVSPYVVATTWMPEAAAVMAVRMVRIAQLTDEEDVARLPQRVEQAGVEARHVGRPSSS